MTTTCTCSGELKQVAVLSNAKSLITALMRCKACKTEQVVTMNVKRDIDYSSETIKRPLPKQVSPVQRPMPTPVKEERKYERLCKKCNQRRATTGRSTRKGYKWLCLNCAVAFDKGINRF